MVFVFVNMTIISFALEGEAGLAATRLSSDITSTASTMEVITTSGFLSADYVFIGNEIICYTGLTATSFTGLSRGCKSTTADSHATAAKVFNETTGVINQAVGFNLAEAMSTAGFIKTITLAPGALFHAVPKLVMWNYSYLEGDLFEFPLAYIKYMILWPLSAGFVITFTMMMINVFMGIARVVV